MGSRLREGLIDQIINLIMVFWLAKWLFLMWGVIILGTVLLLSCVREIPGPPGPPGDSLRVCEDTNLVEGGECVTTEALLGPSGPPGEQGARGSDGPQGLPGPSPRISPVLETECDSPLVRYDPNLDLYTLCFPIPASGTPGEPGVEGPKGVAGQRGIPGKDGEKGDQGEKGAGEPGPMGEPGEKGEKGSQGDPGLKGKDGEPGGPEGEMGPKGEQGEKGNKGDLGPQGNTGPRGITGDTGEKGPQGDKGVGGILGWERISFLDFSDDTVKEADAVCSEGRVVMGGGYVTDKNGINILNSFPIHDGSGWRVKAVGKDGDYKLRAYALCGEKE